MSTKTYGFAHDQMGQILLLLSEFRLNAHNWIVAQGIMPDVDSEATWSHFSVSHDLSIYPEEGVPCLQLSTVVGLTANSNERYWWDILINLPMKGVQHIHSRLRGESVAFGELGPQTVVDIFKGELPCEDIGVIELEKVCDATFQHMKSSLFGKTVNEFSQECKTRLSLSRINKE